MDIQATAEIINWTVNGITLLLFIIASSLAIKKKIAFGPAVVLFGNLVVFYFTRSPLLCWIVSIACIIWFASIKEAEQKQDSTKQSPKSSAVSASDNKGSKVGNVIGLIIGIGLVAGPLIGYLRQEASLSDPTNQGVLILFAVIGGFMIINNLFKLLETDTVSSPSASVSTPSKKAPETKTESESEKKIRCRFCDELYSAEYNGCPYCKMK